MKPFFFIPTIPKVTNTILIDEDFTFLNGSWVNNGFTVNNGLEASGTGSMTFNIESIYTSFLDNQNVAIDVVVNDATSKFAVSKNLAFRGNIATVDLNASTLYLGIIATNNTEPTYEFSRTISTPITVGQTYRLEMTKDRNVITAKFYNKANPEVYDSIVRNYDVNDTFAGSFWGKPTAIFFNGNIKIKRFLFTSSITPTPKVAIYGDSITEGYTLIDQTGNLKSRWSDKLYVANDKSVCISSQGGIATAGTLNYIDFEQQKFKPTYTILFLGANDTNFATWNANLETLIAKVEAINSIPVLCTILPRSDRQAFINLANAELLNNKSAYYDIIDFAAAVTDNRDRLTWSSGNLLPDNVHPTVQGHQAMYNEILLNNAYLSNGEEPSAPEESDDFIFVVNSSNAGTSSSNQFTIPTTGSGYDYSISTSDGYSASGITGSHTITFPTGAGEHTVTISGDFPRLYFNNGGDKLKLISIENWGNYGLGSTNQDRAFRGCENIVNNTSDEPHFSLVTSFAFTFQNCNNLVIPPVADYSAGENFSYCWFGCDIVSFPSIDISAGTNFSDTFRSNFNLTDFPANMFDSCLGTNFTRAFKDTNLNQTSIDNILVSLDTANQSGGSFEQSNGSAPSSVGATAIDNLRSRGWTVIVTGGY